MKDTIKVLVRRAGEEPTVEIVENSLDSMQKIVGGYIEMPFNPELSTGLQLVCNEEGKFASVPQANLYWNGIDVIFGDVVFVGIGDEGENISLTPEQINEARAFIDEYDASILQKAGIDGNDLANVIMDLYSEINNGIKPDNGLNGKKKPEKDSGSEM